MGLGLSSIITLFTLMFARPMPGWSTVWRNIQVGNNTGALQSAVANLSGIRLQGGGQGVTEFQLKEVVNPLNFHSAPALKVGILSSVLIKILKKYIGNPLSGIPIVRDIISFS